MKDSISLNAVNVGEVSQRSIHKDWECDSGRFKERKCNIISSKETLLDKHRKLWSEIQTSIEIKSIRTIFKG